MPTAHAIPDPRNDPAQWLQIRRGAWKLLEYDSMTHDGFPWLHSWQACQCVRKSWRPPADFQSFAAGRAVGTRNHV